MSHATTMNTAPDDPHAFEPTAEGSGAFGHWQIDQAGLPAYCYDCDQIHDARAAYPTTAGLDRRDHWHQIGNDRITAFASNDGTLQVYVCDRGGAVLNRFEAHEVRRAKPPAPSPASTLYSADRADELRQARQPELAEYLTQLHEPEEQLAKGAPRGLFDGAHCHAYAGGFSYLEDNTEIWATAFRYHPTGASTRRVFGLGYFETELTHRNIRVTRHVYAPFDEKPIEMVEARNDEPVLIVDVQVENLGSTVVDLHHYEYWDVNRYQVKLQWLRSGYVPAAIGDLQRYAINDGFTPSVWYDQQIHTLRFHQEASSPDAQPPGEISPIDWSPADIFLADLSSQPPAAYYTQKSAFFGDGDARQPRPRPESASPSDGAMPYCLVLRHDLQLEPRATMHLRFAFGTVRPKRPLQLPASLLACTLPDVLNRWKSQLAYFTTGQQNEAYLQREMAWHTYNLLSATVYHEYYHVNLVPQGSAYLYLHGADGAPRDQGLFVIPLTYVRPQLARDTLRLIMRLTHADTGAIPYAFGGYGVHDGAMVHTNPSDLDLFFLLAMSEYLAATGDTAFLDREEPFYPFGTAPTSVAGSTVLDHIRVAAWHLMHTIGTGDHGLLRIGDGDWSDGIVLETVLKHPLDVSFARSKANGESIPNTQMALYVLPLIAASIESRDPALAAEMRNFAARLKEKIVDQWSGHGDWYNRAILRDHFNNPVVWDADQINLEAQPWALIGELAAETGREAALIKSIAERLDDPSPIGAALREGGMVWPAVSQLLTWGYTRSRPDLAWRSLQRHTFAAHAKAFPNVWINIWSGPDGVNGPNMENPGGTWWSPLTPMTDFPVMNANQDAMALLGLLRVCGIEPAPSGDGLLIAPQAPPDRFALDLPLLRLEVDPGRIAGEYRAVVAGSRVLYVRVPAGASGLTAAIGGRLIQISQPNAAEVPLSLTFNAGQKVPFEVRWNA